MSAKPTSNEIRLSLARMARLAPDNVEGYLVILARGNDVLATMSNAADVGTELTLLGRAVEHRAVNVSAMEERIVSGGH